MEPESQVATLEDEPIQFRAAAGRASAVAIPVVGGLALSFVLSVVLARWLGVAEFGTYVYVWSWVAVLGTIAVFGLENTIVSQIPTYVANASWGLLRGLIRWANGLTILIWLGLVAIGLLARSLLVGSGQTVPVEVWLIGGSLVGLTALLRVQQAALRALHRPALSQVPSSVIVPALVLGLLTVFVLTGSVGPTAANALLAQVAAMTATVVIAAWLVSRSIPREATTASPRYAHRGWSGTASRMLLISVLATLNNRIGILVLGVMTAPQDVGAYSVALRGAGFIPFAMDVAVLAIAPAIAVAYGAGRIDRVRHLARQISRIALIGGLPVAVVLIVWGRTFLSLFGPGFETAAGALAILAVGELANIGAGPVATMLMMTGHERDAVVGLASGTALNALLCLILIPQFGINGAALAAAASVLLWNAVLWRFVRLRLPIGPSIGGGDASVTGSTGA